MKKTAPIALPVLAGIVVAFLVRDGHAADVLPDGRAEGDRPEPVPTDDGVEDVDADREAHVARVLAEYGGDAFAAVQDEALTVDDVISANLALPDAMPSLEDDLAIIDYWQRNG